MHEDTFYAVLLYFWDGTVQAVLSRELRMS